MYTVSARLPEPAPLLPGLNMALDFIPKSEHNTA